MGSVTGADPRQVYHGLQTVGGLKAGRSDAKESDPIAPVADEHVAPVLPFARLQDRLRVEWAAGTSKVVDRQPGEPVNEVTRILSAAGQGDRDAASKLLPLVYDELRKLAAQRLAHEQPNQTLQATALVHEAYLRLVDADQIPHFDGRGHFFAAAAEAMRRILIENARHKQSLKAGGGRLRLDLDDVDPAIEAPAPTRGLDLLALDEALTKLERDDKIKAELVKLRYFGGLTLEEAGLVLRLSPATADRYWAFARAWLYRELSAGAP